MGIVYGLERHRNRSPRIRNAVCFIIVAQRVIHVKCIVCRSPVTVKIASATSTLRNKIINCYVIEFSSVLRFSFTLPCRVCCAVCTVHCVSGNREVCPLICFETHTVWIASGETVQHLPLAQIRIGNFVLWEDADGDAGDDVAVTKPTPNKYGCLHRTKLLLQLVVIRNCLIVFEVTNSIRFCFATSSLPFFSFASVLLLLASLFLIRHKKQSLFAPRQPVSEWTALVIHISVGMNRMEFISEKNPFDQQRATVGLFVCSM